MKSRLGTNTSYKHTNISDVGIYDRVVIQQLIKDIAQTQNVDTSVKKPFKVVVINEADSLSKDAQVLLIKSKFINNV